MEKIPLKKIITFENRPLITVVFLIFFGVCYLGSGAISNKFGLLLPLLAWEEAIPLMPWTIWIYMVFYPLYLSFAYRQINNEVILNRAFYCLVLLTIISCLIFIILPISYPRLYYPLSPEDNLTNRLFSLVRMADTPSNCLPSLHVGLCFMMAWLHLKNNKKVFIIGMLSTIIISISTLTTKQHYFYDIVTGFILSTLIYFIIDRMTYIKDA